MATNYIPTSNADFANWLANFSTLLTASPTTYGLVTGDATAVAAQNTAFQSAYTAATDPTTRTSPTVAAMQTKRTQAEAVVRPLAVRISLNAGVTDLNKTAIGVTVRKTVPTPVPPPTTTPALSLQSGTHLNHQLRYYDTSTPTAKAKPVGSTGIEIWRNIGTTAATDPAQCSYYQTWTKSPNISTFLAGDVGKICTYYSRWVTRGGPGGTAQTGPWSASLVLAIM